MSGGPQLLQLRPVESSPHHRGSVVAHQEEPAPATGDPVGRRLLCEPDLPLRQRPTPRPTRGSGTGDRLSTVRRGPRTAVPAADHGAGCRIAPGPGTATLYHERWEIETALDELKTHLRDRRNSRTRPPGVLGPDVGPLRSAPSCTTPPGRAETTQTDSPTSTRFVPSVATSSPTALSVRTAAASISLTNSSTNGWYPVATGARPAVSSAR